MIVSGNSPLFVKHLFLVLINNFIHISMHIFEANNRYKLKEIQLIRDMISILLYPSGWYKSPFGIDWDWRSVGKTNFLTKHICIVNSSTFVVAFLLVYGLSMACIAIEAWRFSVKRKKGRQFSKTLQAQYFSRLPTRETLISCVFPDFNHLILLPVCKQAGDSETKCD